MMAVPLDTHKAIKGDLEVLQKDLKGDLSEIKTDLTWIKKFMFGAGIAVLVAALKYIFTG